MKNWTLRFRASDKKLFGELVSGAKSIETRAATIKFKPIEVGDTLTFVCGTERCVKKVMKKSHWKNVDAMLQEVDFKKVMPSVASVAEMKQAYASYSGYEQKIKEHGLFGFVLG